MSLSDIPLEQTMTRISRRKRSGSMRLFAEEAYGEEEACVVCLEKDFQPAMKMCPSCRSAFHSHCIAGWLLEFDNSTCPHCRTRLAYRVLEDVEVVLPFKALRTSSTQTISQTRSTMRSVECQMSEAPLQAHHQTMVSLNGSRIAQLTSGSGERSPASPLWSPVSPYFSSPITHVCC